MDLVANYVKEKRRDLIPVLVEEINSALEEELAGLDIAPLSVEEVLKYYRDDARIWSIYLAARKMHRAIVSKILRGRYEYILPEHIERW